MNPMDAMRMAQAWSTFSQNHPKFLPFIRAVSQGALQEGSVIELAVTQPDGKKLETNLRLTASDLDLIAQIKGLIPPQ
ncbi:MAG: hypothetical protein BWY61_01106 [Firmicutes bacterium ADurb.Bin354]|nr:MAG: hypothetical protein BWY61_01106 [Firmicutes bacterium ADurb.Bin354]SCY05804.1 hypothetical protein SAMN02910370_01149 [Lachnospiraceae bacterium XPB1003]